MTGSLLCVGDLNADITITTTTDIRDGSDTSGTVRLTGGGSAANVAVAAVHEGVATRFAGVVGDDLLGRVMVDELAGLGVDVRAVRRADASSRAIAALVGPGGDRSMISDLSTAMVMSADDVDAAWFDGVDWLHLTGYSYFPAEGPALLRRAVDVARQRRIPWSFDPSSAEMLRSECRGRDLAADLRGAEVMFPNHDEAIAMTGRQDPESAASALLDLAACVVVTCGADGAFVARRDGEAFHVTAPPVPVVNTLGCGDAFAGAFVAAGLRGLGVRAAADAAVARAAQVAQQPTAR